MLWWQMPRKVWPELPLFLGHRNLAAWLPGYGLFFTWYIFTNLSLTPVATSLQHHFLLTCLPGVMSLCYLRDLLQNSLRKHILPCLSALLHVGCIFGSHGYQVIFHVKTVWLADFWWNLASRLHGTWDMTFSYNISYYKGVLLYTYSAYNCISVRECRI